MRTFLLKGILCNLVLAILFLSCQKQERSQYPVIDIAKYSEHLWGVWGDGKYYTGLGTVYLHQTNNLTPDDVKEMKIYRQKVYLLTSAGSLMRFDLKSGQKECHYTGRFKSFDIDTLKRHIYALDKNQEFLYTYSCLEDSFFIRKNISSLGYNYESCIYLSDEKVLLTTNYYPNGTYIITNMRNGNLQQHAVAPKHKSKYTLLPDTFQLKAYTTGICERGVLFKHLLNDTIFIWEKDRFSPFLLCNTSGKGIMHKEAVLWMEEQLFQNNEMLALLRMDEVNDTWFVNYKHKITRKGNEWYLNSLALLKKDFALREMNNYIFCLEKKKIVVNPRFPYFVDKERKGLYQIYRKEAHPFHNMGNEVEVLDYMKTHISSDDLILCYFNF